MRELKIEIRYDRHTGEDYSVIIDEKYNEKYGKREELDLDDIMNIYNGDIKIFVEDED